MEKGDVLFPHRADQEITDEYKLMIDLMLTEENEGVAEYVTYQSVKDKFMPLDK